MRVLRPTPLSKMPEGPVWNPSDLLRTQFLSLGILPYMGMVRNLIVPKISSIIQVVASGPEQDGVHFPIIRLRIVEAILLSRSVF